jgi:hypothetical protein
MSQLGKMATTATSEVTCQCDGNFMEKKLALGAGAPSGPLKEKAEQGGSEIQDSALGPRTRGTLTSKETR